MFARRPARPVELDLTDDLEGGQRIHPIHLRRVDPSHRGKRPVDIAVGGVRAVGVPAQAEGC